MVLDSRGDVLHVIQTLVPPVHLKRPLMVHNHNVVVVLELGIFKLYPDMVGESLGPDDGADPEAGVLGLQLGDAGVDGGGVVEDVLLVWLMAICRVAWPVVRPVVRPEAYSKLGTYCNTSHGAVQTWKLDLKV